MTEENATLEAETVDTDIADAIESLTQSEGSKETNESTVEEKQGQLSDLLKKLETNPRHKMNDKELDLFEAHLKGSLPEIEKSETKEFDPNKEEKEPELKLPELNIEKVMKKVGAKKPEEIDLKIDGLKKRLSERVEKDPQYQELSKKVSEFESKISSSKELVDSHVGFIADLQNGLPLAIKHFEKITGLKIAQGNAKAESQDDDGEYDNYLDTDLAKAVHSNKSAVQKELDSLRAQLNEMKARDESREGEFKKHQEINSKESAKREIEDEMVSVADSMDLFVGVKNKRAMIERWQKNELSEQDSQLINDTFTELFNLANEKGLNLEDAHILWKGKNAPRLIEQAKQDGKKSAYSHKPNKTLSSQQGQSMQNDGMSRERIIEIIQSKKGATLFPDKWFDKNGRPMKSEIPKHSHDLFGF